MPDDIAARITIAVETANATQQCEEIEKALEGITAARREDLSVAEKSTNQAKESASAVQEETSAMSDQTAARKADTKEAERQLRYEKELAKIRAEEAAKNRARANTDSGANERVKGISPEEARKAVGLDPISPAKEKEMHEEHLRNVKEFNRKMDEAVAREEAKKQKAKKQKAKTEDSDISYAERKKAQEEEMAAAKRAMLAREEAEAQARDLIARRSFVSEQEAQKELARIDLIAARRKQMEAVINQDKISEQLKRQKDLLYNETDKGAGGDPRKVQAFQNNVRKLENELTKAQRTTLQTEQAARKAEQQVRKFGNSTRDAGNKANSAADKNQRSQFGKFIKESMRGVKGLGRALGSQVTGIDLNTRNLTDQDKQLATFSAGMLAVGAIGNFVNKAYQLWQEERSAELEMRMANLNSIKEATMRVERESSERNQQVNTLAGYNSKDKLTLKEQTHQQQILNRLNRSLDGMQISIDKTSGKIINFGELQEKIAIGNKKKEIASYELEIKNIDAETSRHEKFLEKATAFTQTYDMQGIKDAQAAVERLSARRMELQEKRNQALMFLGDEQTRERAELRWAGLKDEYKGIYKQRVSDMQGTIAWRREQKFFGNKRAENEATESYEATQLAKYKKWVDARKKRIAEIKKILKDDYIFSSSTNRLTTEKKQSLYAEINMIYKNLLPYHKKIDTLEQASFERMKRRVQIDKTLKEKKDELKIQDLLRRGEVKKAEALKLQLDLEKKKKEEGYTDKQLKAYRANVLEERRQARDERFTELYKETASQYRATSQGAIMSDSIEAMRLQSRMLVRNTPQQQLLDVNKQQYKVQQQIANNTRGGVRLRVVQA